MHFNSINVLNKSLEVYLTPTNHNVIIFLNIFNYNDDINLYIQIYSYYSIKSNT